MRWCTPFVAALAVISLVACEQRSDITEPTSPADATPMFEEVMPLDLVDNPIAPDIPAATVAIEEVLTSSLQNAVAGTISPPTLTAVLQAGESVTETKIVSVASGIFPPRADILFAFDLTGSMSQELANVKVNSSNIMSAIRAAIPLSVFGLVSHMDYVGLYSGCGYTATYGSPGDYPYRLDQAFTDNTANVTTAINGLVLGSGFDGPEDYTRVMYEAYSDPGIIWRTDAARFLVYWHDAAPHDCSYFACLGGVTSTGPDPGRDGIANNSDDLDLTTTLQGLSDADISLVALHSGGNLAIWDCYAGDDGGAFQINTDGTIPGGTNIADFIVDKIEEVFNQVDLLELEASSGYEGWLTSSTTFGPIDLSEGGSFSFPITITVPGGTEPGIYNFQVCAVADGVTLAICQDVMIVVYDPSGGFVTGGGWIYSAPGSYKLPDQVLEGKATFGFVSKYKKGASTPMGSTEFQFHAAGMNFHSSSYDWLLVTGQGDFARFKGEGTINGGTCGIDGPYKFHLWAGDDVPDTFRIRIWCEDGAGFETDLYDNGSNQPISAGNIVIHTK